jgi:hypothetical protein
MEYYEGASYKINIEGYDSTLILDGYTRTLKATVIDQNDNIMVDHETGTLYGTLVGNIVDTDNNLIFDSERRIIHAEQFKGSIVDKHGDIVFDHNQTTFSGTFVGDLHGNIMSGETVIYDRETQSINANIIGNLFSADGGLSYDHDRNIFQGTFVGNFLDQDGNLLFSSSDTTQNFGDNVLMYSDGTIALDLQTKIITGSLWGNIVTQEGNVLLNAESEGFYGNVHGHVFSRDGAILLDVDTRTITGNLIGNICNADGFLIFDHETFELRSNVMGNILASDGSIIVDTQTGVIVGTVVGNVSGNIVNSDMMTVFDSDIGKFAIPIQVDIFGSVTGNIYDTDGDKILDADERTLQINSIISNSISSTFFGTLIGDIIDSDGLVVYSSDSNEFLGTVTGQLEGNIFNSSGQIVYNFETKEFNLDTVKIVDSLLRLDYENNSLSIGKSPSSVPYSGGSVVIYSNQDIYDDYNPLNIFVSKHSENLAGINLSRSRGTIDNPLPVQPGDKLTGIVFGGQSGEFPDSAVLSGILEVVVPENANVEPGKIPGQFNISLVNNDGELNQVFSIDPNGNVTTTIQNLTVVGETGNAPLNLDTPTKWLEMSVNGETVFMPLYQ